MPRRSIHRRRRAQGGCLSFAIGVLAVTALALAVAILVMNRLKPPADGVSAPDAGVVDGGFVDANDPPTDEHEMVLKVGDLGQGDEEILVLTPSPSPTIFSCTMGAGSYCAMRAYARSYSSLLAATA